MEHALRLWMPNGRGEIIPPADFEVKEPTTLPEGLIPGSGVGVAFSPRALIPRSGIDGVVYSESKSATPLPSEPPSAIHDENDAGQRV